MIGWSLVSPPIGSSSPAFMVASLTFRGHSQGYGFSNIAISDGTERHPECLSHQRALLGIAKLTDGKAHHKIESPYLMPLYEYECKKCHHRFERIQKFSDPYVKKCPDCGG